MLRLLQRLRQACNHPWLVRGEADSNVPGLVPSAQLAAARKLDPSIRNDLLEALQVTVLIIKTNREVCLCVLTGPQPMGPCWITDATAHQQPYPCCMADEHSSCRGRQSAIQHHQPLLWTGTEDQQPCMLCSSCNIRLWAPEGFGWLDVSNAPASWDVTDWS